MLDEGAHKFRRKWLSARQNSGDFAGAADERPQVCLSQPHLRHAKADCFHRGRPGYRKMPGLISFNRLGQRGEFSGLGRVRLSAHELPYARQQHLMLGR